MTSKLPPDNSYDVEQQFIFRMTDPVASQNLCADIEAGISFKENFTIEFKPDLRNAIVRYNGQVYQGHLMDLPCIIESMKTTDKSSFYKTADIFQMMVCTQGADNEPLRGTAAYLDNRAGSRANAFDLNRENREFQFLHGITPPLKNVLRRRFRKTRRKRFVDMPRIEKEVKRLIRADLQAESVKWEVIWSDPPTTSVDASTRPGSTSTDPSKSASADGSSTSTAVNQTDHELDEEEAGGGQIVDRRHVFGDLSSSSSSNSSASSSPGWSSADDEEQRRSTVKSNPADGDVQAKSHSDNHANSQKLQPMDTEFSKQTEPADNFGLGSLKEDLAAELLLSDSGNEEEFPNSIQRHLDLDDDDPDSIPRCHEDELEDVLQASVAAELVAHASKSHQYILRTADGDDDDTHVHDLDDVDGYGDDDDDDDIVHRGGELLDDAALIGLSSSLTDATHEVFDHGLEYDEG